ncbi:hypothetical protein MMC11_008292 [Xylographa trunciseda]|nr:hypothetical protein [Xylographa trunciseda]
MSFAASSSWTSERVTTTAVNAWTSLRAGTLPEQDGDAAAAVATVRAFRGFFVVEAAGGMEGADVRPGVALVVMELAVGDEDLGGRGGGEVEVARGGGAGAEAEALVEAGVEERAAVDEVLRVDVDVRDRRRDFVSGFFFPRSVESRIMWARSQKPILEWVALALKGT